MTAETGTPDGMKGWTRRPGAAQAIADELRAGWFPKPGASAAWINAAGAMLFPTYGSWAVRWPDGTERWFYSLRDALTAAR